MKSFWLTERTSLLINLAKTGMFQIPIAKVIFINPGPKTVTAKIARTICGIDINTSITRIIIKSIFPPTYPASVPKGTPIMKAHKTEINPISNETRAP